MRLFCDCKTDEEKSNFFLSGMAVETGIIAPAISNDVAMAYHRCAQFKKENDELRAKIEAMEKQKPVAWCATDETGTVVEALGMNQSRRFDTALYLAPGAQPAPSIPEGVKKVTRGFHWNGAAQHHTPTIEVEFEPVPAGSPNTAKGWQDRDRLAAMLAAAPEAKP